VIHGVTVCAVAHCSSLRPSVGPSQAQWQGLQSVGCIVYPHGRVPTDSIIATQWPDYEGGFGLIGGFIVLSGIQRVTTILHSPVSIVSCSVVLVP
jgi:hypothetical protein